MTDPDAPPLRLLLVEDDEDDFLLTRDLLGEVRGVRFDVYWARSYAEGVRSLTEEAYDVVLLDYRLGGATGLDFLREIGGGDAPPAILLTGQADRETDLAALRAGAADYLGKSGLTAALLERSIRYAVERGRAQAGRRTAESRLQQLVESVGAIVWQGTADPLGFTFVSREAEHLLGYPTERWVAEPTFWADHIHPDDREWVLALCRKASAEGEPHTFEYRMTAADGRVVWLRDIVRPVQAAARRELAGVMIDVTAAKEAQEQLLLRERALAAVSEGIVITDPHRPDNPIISVNPAFERMTGYTAAEVLGRNCRFLQGPDSDPAVVAQLREGIDAETPVTVDLLNYRKDGTAFWNRLSLSPVRDAAGRLTHFVGVQHDITGRRRAREELEAGHALLRAIIDGTPDAVFAKDPDGRYLLVNQAGAVFLGRTPAGVVGRTDEELLPAETAREFRRADLLVMETGETYIGEETEASGGSPRTYHALKSPIRGPDGQVVGVVGISRDITSRKRMEEALLDSNERFVLVQRATQDVVWDWDVAAGKLRWNDQLAHTFGYPVVESSLAWWAERVHPDDAGRAAANLDAALRAAGSWSDEYRFRRADGSYATVLERGYIIRGENGAALRAIGSILDITERRELRAALERREAHYRRLVNNAPQAIYALDVQGRFTEINPAGAELLGRAPEELLGRPFQEVIAAEDGALSTALFGRIMDGSDATMDTVLRVVRPSGEVRWSRIDATAIREDGAVSGIHGIARDITEERARESEMRLFAAALENLEESVSVLDEEARIVYANAAYCRMLGCEREAWAREGILAFARDPAARRELLAILEQVRTGGVWRGLVDLRRLDGQVVRVSCHMERVEQDGRTLVFTICRDVGAELEQEQRLRRAERLASIGTLVSGVAHELNNPLAAIVGFAQLLLMDERPAGEREDLETIGREAQRMAEIVSNLRLLARGTQEEKRVPRAVDLADVVRHVLRTRGYTLRTHNIEVREDVDPDLPAALGDRAQLEQVVLNLVVNAEQAIAMGEEPGRLIVRARPSRVGVSLQVVDNGPGIAAEHLDRIFDPFFTTKRPGEGTGLGLSLVHSIVEEHGGQIHVDSQRGGGTAFRVELPAAVAPSGRGAPREGDAGDEAPERRLRVLVVDDEEPVRRAVTRYLARRGHSADQAADGAEALERLDAATGSDRAYDVVVSDLRMPGLSGRQLLARLRERGDEVWRRVIFLTGDTAGEEVGRITAEADLPVLTKPVDLGALTAVVERVGGSWVGHVRGTMGDK